MKKKWEIFSDVNFFRGIAIVFLLFILAVFIPILGSMSLIFTPLPILYYSFKIGRIRGMILTVIALSLVSAIAISSDIKINLIVLYLFGFLGLLLFETINRGISIEKTILYPTIFLCLISFAILIYQCYQTGKQPLELIELYIAGNIQESIRIYTKLELPPEQINLIKDNARQITLFFTKIYPALVLVAISFTVWLNVLAGRILFERNAIPYPSFGDLSFWKAPEKTVWILIATGGIILIPAEEFKFVGLNLLIICFFIYLLQGLSIISFLFKRKNVPNVLKIIFYFLIFAQQYILLLVIAVGIFDLWINFRKFIRPLNNSAVS